MHHATKLKRHNDLGRLFEFLSMKPNASSLDICLALDMPGASSRVSDLRLRLLQQLPNWCDINDPVPCTRKTANGRTYGTWKLNLPKGFKPVYMEI